MRPPQTGGQATFFDGQSARRHPVQVRVTGGPANPALEITADGHDWTVIWPLADLRALADDANPQTITVTLVQAEGDENPRDTARLRIEDPDWVGWIRASRPNLMRKDVSRPQLRRLARRAGLAVAAIVVILFVILPSMANTLAGLIPVKREIAFGKRVMVQIEAFLGADAIGDLRCEGGEGRAALAKMLARLSEGGALSYDIELVVFDHEMMNAFAAPGGQIVLMRGLIERAESPDQVAAVLAHEIGHVEARDPTRAGLRTAGSAGILSIAIGDFAGAAVIALVGEHLLNTRYTRTAEAEADTYALTLLDAAGVDIGGLAGFFDLVAEVEGDHLVPQYLSSHPPTQSRADRALVFAERQGETQPILTQTEWQALRGICRG